MPLAPGTGLLARCGCGGRSAQPGSAIPVILKATAGGGGIGMRVCADEPRNPRRLRVRRPARGGQFRRRRRFSRTLRRHRARHIEVQVFGDGSGRVVALGERDCSLQRRNQKVVEETPAPHLPPATRAAMIDAAVRLTAAARYRSAGTVEFLYDADRDDFFFLEVNTRLQVEHGVTEQVTGVDLVEWMVRGAAGRLFVPRRWDRRRAARRFDPGAALRRGPGTGLPAEFGPPDHVAFPADVRVDGWIEQRHRDVEPFYDPMLAKLIVTAPDRAAARSSRCRQALDRHRAGRDRDQSRLASHRGSQSEIFISGQVSTGRSGDNRLRAADGSGSGRRRRDDGAGLSRADRLVDVGVPPSGPMDRLAFRLGNRLLGNATGAAGLEITAAGPTLRFNAAPRLCLGRRRFRGDARRRAGRRLRDRSTSHRARRSRSGGSPVAGCAAISSSLAASTCRPISAASSAFTLGELRRPCRARLSRPATRFTSRRARPNPRARRTGRRDAAPDRARLGGPGALRPARRAGLSSRTPTSR